MIDQKTGAIWIREDEVAQLLPMDQAIAALDDAFRAWAEGKAENRPRARVYAPGAILHVMSAAWSEAGVMGLKSYSVTRESVRFKVLLYDTHTGRLLALIEANRLGQIRTGAATGLATQYLARPEASTVGLVGAGWQARSQLEAVCAVRPIQGIRVYSRTPETLAQFCTEMSAQLGLPVEPAGSAEAAVQGQEILIAATSARDPVVLGRWLEPGQHLNAVGANQIARRELDTEGVVRSHVVVVDSKEQARIESGDLMLPISEGQLAWEDVLELMELVAGRASGRKTPQDITLFKSLGLALEDIAVGNYVYRQAVEQGLGERLPFE